MSVLRITVIVERCSMVEGVSSTPQGSKVAMVQGGGRWGSGQDGGQSNSRARGSHMAHIFPGRPYQTTST